MAEDNITISWVRHAESDANIIEGYGTMTDFYDFMEKPNKKKNLNHRGENYTYTQDDTQDDFKKLLIDSIKKRELKEYGEKLYRMKIRLAAFKFKESTNYKLFEKIQQVIKEEREPTPEQYKNWATEYIKEIQMKPKKMYEDIKKFELDEWTENEKYDSKTKFNIPKPPSSWFFTPTITYNGVRQAKLLGTDYLNKNLASYDLIICSGSVRTIMTALFSICSSFGEDNVKRDTFFENNKLNIVPYINEKYNGAGEFDKANATVPPVIIDEVVDMIIDFCVANEYSLLEFPRKTILKKFIETSPYKKYIETSKEELKKYSEGNYEKFISEFLPSFIGDKKTILAYSHGKNIDEDVKKGSNEKFREAFFPNNCSLWKVHYNKKSGDGSGYERDGTKDIKPDTKWNEIIVYLKDKYVSRKSYPISDEFEIDIPELEKRGFPFPAYFGSFARRTDTEFDEEIKNVLDKPNYWGCLDRIKCLRGKINHLWINCYADNIRNIEKPECGREKTVGEKTVDELVEFHEGEIIRVNTGGRKRTRRRHKSRTKRKNKRRSKLTKRRKRKTTKIYI